MTNFQFCSYLGIMAIVLMLCALPFLTGKGYYIFQTFDDWSGSLPLVVIAFFQCIAVAWVYGNDKYVVIVCCVLFFQVEHRILQGFQQRLQDRLGRKNFINERYF